MRTVVALIAAALTASGHLRAQSSGSATFVTVALPHDVSVEVPRNWVILSNNQRVTLDASVQSRLDLSGASVNPSELPFGANLYDDAGNTIGILNVRYYPSIDISQADAQAANAADVRELDAALEQQSRRGLASSGVSISSWSGTTRQDINGIAAFVSEYRRPSMALQGDFRVRLVRVFASERSFTLTVSYWEPQARLLEPIADRVIGSLQLAAGASAPPSSMTQVFGDQWPLVLMFSALVTWGIGLAPSLILRFGVLRRPIANGPALAIVVALWLFNVVLLAALGSQSRSNAALALVAVVSYVILRRGAKRIGPSSST